MKVCAALLLAGSLFVSVLGALGPDGKELIVSISWGDQVSDLKQKPLITADSFDATFRQLKSMGVDKILFRLDVLRWVHDYHWPEPRAHYRNAPRQMVDIDQRQWEMSFLAVKKNLLADVVRLAHSHGLAIYAFHSVFDEGMPLEEIWYTPEDRGEELYTAFLDKNGSGAAEKIRPPGVYSPMVSRFVEQHPECVPVDRAQKEHNWGSLEFACPEARAYVVGYNRKFLEEYPFDGVYINFRNEFGHPAHGDQFGFARQIVDEYQKRYGVNILRDQFDLEKWRRLRGEYLTQMIRELSQAVHAKSKPLLVGVPQGNYMGIPVGNLYVDWRSWVDQRLIDGLVIGDISGKFLFPKRVGYGYLTEQEDGMGLKNILWDLDNTYWPVCAARGVKLYVIPHRWGFKQIPPEQFRKTRVDGVFIPTPKIGPGG